MLPTTAPAPLLPATPTQTQQVETQLREVNAHFARLNGMSGAHMLDLYGRTAAQQAAAPPSAPALARKPSKRLALSESTRALIRQAHSKIPKEALAGLSGSQAGSQPGSPPVGGVAPQLPSAPVSRTPSVSQGPGGALQLGGELSRQPTTVRFDMTGGGGSPVARAASALAAQPGVLQIPDEREDRLLPYRCAALALACWRGFGLASESDSQTAAAMPIRPHRRLVIRTSSEPSWASPPPLAGAAAAAPASSDEIQPDSAELSAGSGRSGRDWGHIPPPASERATHALGRRASWGTFCLLQLATCLPQG